MNDTGIAWLKFVRQYGPIAANDSMYDETIQRSAHRKGLRPVVFDHPQAHRVMECVVGQARPESVVLTGTAGDGKTHLCGDIWKRLGGDIKTWASNAPYLTTEARLSAGTITVHVIRDLSAWVPQRHAPWPEEKLEVLVKFSSSIFSGGNDIFVLAANDGQLLETWRRVPESEDFDRCRELLETLLVENRERAPGAMLRCFNLSRGSSAELLGRALDAFISHEGWQACYSGSPADNEAFGPECPIRRNLELLKTPLVRGRLRSLFQLCDHNDLHIPIREILLLLANAVLGHPDVADRLMTPADVPQILRDGTRAKASIYNNFFGGNLKETRRDSLPVFEYLNRFRIGHETSNRIDNVLIFGEADETFRAYFDELLIADKFYGADESYRREQRAYIEAGEEDEERSSAFLEQLVSQRRALFFKIPLKWEDDLHLWELTVFKYAGEYLRDVVETLNAGNRVPGPIVARLVRGLNRIFVGMLVAGDRELYLATSLSFSNAKVSRLLEERISVSPRLGEKVEVKFQQDVPTLNVVLSPTVARPLPLHLVRYEFLSRVADGALPNSFSRECHEDMLAYKSQLLAALEHRRADSGGDGETSVLSFRMLDLDESGIPSEETVEVKADA